GRADLAADPDLATPAGRRARHDELDAAISAWARQQDAAEAASVLQAAGGAATPTLTALAVIADEHLAARSVVQRVERLAAGTRRALGAPWLSEGQRPDGFRRPPQVGEDNEYVFRTLLRLPAAEYEALVREQVIY